MKIAAIVTTVVLSGLLLSGSAWAGRSDVADPALPCSLPADGPVSVAWTDPARFSEIRYSRNRSEARRGDWVREIARYLRKDASKQLPQGDRLEVTITDIERAGEYEPGRNGLYTVRYMRDIYPPHIDLQFRLMGADGTVLAEGTRKLTDPGYLMGSLRLSDTDPLRYEKKLISEWRRREFRIAGL